MMNRAEQQLLDIQTQFAHSIRNPTGTQVPADVPPERMAVYRELFFSNIAGGIASAFPVAKETLDSDLWQRLIETFWRDHQSHTPEFPRLAVEFLNWIDQWPERESTVPPWLLDLLIWEHAELDAMLCEDDPDAGNHDPIEGIPQITGTLRLFAFDYPVHRIGPDWQPTDPQQTFLACFRTPALTIDFLELTPASAALLEQISAGGGVSGTSHIEALANRLGFPVADIAEFARTFIIELTQKGVITGAEAPPEDSPS